LQDRRKPNLHRRTLDGRFGFLVSRSEVLADLGRYGDVRRRSHSGVGATDEAHCAVRCAWRRRHDCSDRTFPDHGRRTETARRRPSIRGSAWRNSRRGCRAKLERHVRLLRRASEEIAKVPVLIRIAQLIACVRMRRVIHGIWCAVLTLTTLAACRASDSEAGLPRPATDDSILLFNGTGTSPGDVQSIEKILEDEHLSYSTIDSSQLNRISELQLRVYRLFIVPGGNFEIV